jgi:hypothetical protein
MAFRAKQLAAVVIVTLVSFIFLVFTTSSISLLVEGVSGTGAPRAFEFAVDVVFGAVAILAGAVAGFLVVIVLKASAQAGVPPHDEIALTDADRDKLNRLVAESVIIRHGDEDSGKGVWYTNHNHNLLFVGGDDPARIHAVLSQY